MFSGGIDSTYVLARILKDTDDEVIAHHIIVKNHERRHEAEVDAMLNLVPRLRKIRDFEFSTSGMDHTGFNGIPWDMQCVAFTAGIIMRDQAARRQKIDRWTIGTHRDEGHWQHRWDVIGYLPNCVTWPHDPAPFWLPDTLPAKADEMRYLQQLDLLNQVWYCRFPRAQGEVFLPCGACPTCKEVNDAKTDRQPKTSGPRSGADHTRIAYDFRKGRSKDNSPSVFSYGSGYSKGSNVFAATSQKRIQGQGPGQKRKAGGPDRQRTRA